MKDNEELDLPYNSDRIMSQQNFKMFNNNNNSQPMKLMTIKIPMLYQGLEDKTNLIGSNKKVTRQ